MKDPIHEDDPAYYFGMLFVYDYLFKMSNLKDARQTLENIRSLAIERIYKIEGDIKAKEELKEYLITMGEVYEDIVLNKK